MQSCIINITKTILLNFSMGNYRVKAKLMIGDGDDDDDNDDDDVSLAC